MCTEAVTDGSSLPFFLSEVIQVVNEIKGKCDSIEKEFKQP